MGDHRFNSGGRDASRSLPMRGSSISPGRGRISSRGGREPPAGRIYVGNLPSNADKKLVEELFGKFGRIIEISIKRTISGSPFAFVEFEDPRDAQDAIQERDGYKIDGCMLRVEVPFAARSGGKGQSNRGPPRRANYRIFVKGLPPSGSWQDLKDHMREAGDCVYADVFRDGTGVVEFARREDMEYAIRHFDNSKFRSHEGETSRLTVTPMEDEDMRYQKYDNRRSPDNRRHYRGRSPYWDNKDYHHRSGYSRGSYQDDYSDEKRGRSYSGDHYRRSPSRTRSRSRSYRKHR